MTGWDQAKVTSDPISGRDEDIEYSPHVKRASVPDSCRSLTYVSSLLSDARTPPYDPETETGCVEVHHPSLDQWCPDCNGTNGRLREQERQRQQPEFRPDQLADGEEQERW